VQRPIVTKRSAAKANAEKRHPASNVSTTTPIFSGRRPLPFSGSHLRLPSGPVGIRTTTGSLSALARPTPYQLSHRVGYLNNNTQTTPNNMVLWQRLACSFAPEGLETFNQEPCSPGAVPLDLQKQCCLLKLRQFLAIKVTAAISFFFRPTPSWLPPGRYTRSIAAKR